MRIAISIVTGVWATLAVSAGPLLAKTSEAPKPSEAPKISEASKATSQLSSPPPCYSYEQSADGSWKQTPCEEPGLKPQAPSKISTRDAGKATR